MSSPDPKKPAIIQILKYIAIFLAFLTGVSVSAQPISKKALFIGNSYTYVNNLPQMVADATASAGDTLFFDSNSIGGYTFQQHSSNATTLTKISSGNWDYVVLQEQSQLPSFPISQVEVECFPYARKLDSMINVANYCGETVFYMTWGRKNGDASNCAAWPPVCTYQGMDSLLNLRYRMMADSNNAVVSPVGAVWHYIRDHFPAIELYSSDESHPVISGSFAAACCFYTVFFRKDPELITYTASLDSTTAANIRYAVRVVVFDSLMTWHVGEYDPSASFTYNVSGANQISFTNTSSYADSFHWDFGDGDTSASVNPVHTYPTTDTFIVRLIAGKCGMQDTSETNIIITPMGIFQQGNGLQPEWQIFPNPANSFVRVRMRGESNFNYEIFNLTGSEVQNGRIDEDHDQVEISSLPDGMYFFRLFDPGSVFSGLRKIIKISK